MKKGNNEERLNKFNSASEGQKNPISPGDNFYFPKVEADKRFAPLEMAELLHEFAQQEIEHLIDLVCSYLYSEETFTNYVRQKVRAELYRLVKRYLGKVPTATQAVYQAIRDVGSPATIAAQYTSSRPKFRIPWGESISVLVAILVRLTSSGGERILKQLQELVILFIILLMPIILYLLQMLISKRYEVSAQGLYYKSPFRTRRFISWNSIVTLKASWHLLVGRVVVLHLENRKKIKIEPVTTNFAYVVSCLVAKVSSKTKIAPPVYKILQKYVSRIETPVISKRSIFLSRRENPKRV